jgi:hypothetical protein
MKKNIIVSLLSDRKKLVEWLKDWNKRKRSFSIDHVRNRKYRPIYFQLFLSRVREKALAGVVCT